MIPTPFDSNPRTRLVYGPGTLERVGALAKELGATRALVVTDRGIVAAGHVARATTSLEASGVAVVLYEAVRENPTTLDVSRCVEVARAGRVDLLVGLGGGSSMDTAKGANFILTNGGEMKDYHGVGKAMRPMLPLIAIPTTAGTGSECQSAALIADEATHVKMACLDPKAAARVALLDPELTVSQPRRVTALTGTDALVHAVESAVTTRRTPWSLMYSREAFRLCAGALEVVLTEPSNLEARGRMLLGAALAGIAIENSMLGAAHAAANPLTARFGVVHGAAVGLLLPAVIRFNAGVESVRSGYRELALAAGLVSVADPDATAVDRLVAHLEHLRRVAGIPATLSEAGVDPALVPVLAEDAARQWTGGFNPRPVDAASFEALYRSVG
jgi:alcohol dehydrogenase